MCTRAYACTVVALIYNSSSRSIHCGSICHSCARSRTVRTQCTHVKCAHPLLFRQAPLRKNGHIHPGANGHQIGSYTLTCSHNLSPPASSLPSLPSPHAVVPACSVHHSMLPTEPPLTAHIVVSSAHLFRLRVANAPHEEVDHHRELAQHRDHL